MRKETILSIGMVMLLVGLVGLTIGLIVEKKPATVDCYDKFGHKIIGEKCLLNNDENVEQSALYNTCMLSACLMPIGLMLILASNFDMFR